MADTLTKAANLGFARITHLLVQVRDAAKAARGDLANLNTTDKTSLVNALNEIKAATASATGIDDTQSAANKTWSSQKINAEISTAISNLINGADMDSDTLKELADKITALAQADNGLVSANQAQSFSPEQQKQARDNIDVYSKSEIGDISAVNFVATIDAIYTV